MIENEVADPAVLPFGVHVPPPGRTPPQKGVPSVRFGDDMLRKGQCAGTFGGEDVR